MLKLGKGLKKKKKNKKGKKGEELFTAEELEQYKREHAHKEGQEEAGPSEEGKPPANSEEFEKFKLLTSGVDDFLRKSQGDLDRIKKESFFQRKPTPSEIKAQEEKEKAELKKAEGDWEGFEKEHREEAPTEEAHLEDSESEYEADDGDDIFDTAYVDALESGEVKLAYVPDDDEVAFDDGPDPFDTSTADELLRRAEEEERRKKKEVSLGLAVNVLSGRAERDRALLEGNTSEDQRETKTVRTRPRKIQDFCLLGSFDENSPKVPASSETAEATEDTDQVVVASAPKSLLDDDLAVSEELPEGESLIQILAQQVAQPTPPELATPDDLGVNTANLVAEFEVPVAELELKKLEEEDEFDEFSALAASSVINQKLEQELKEYEFAEDDPFDTSVVDAVLQSEPDPFGSVEAHLSHVPVAVPQDAQVGADWAQLDEVVDDPFDTKFAENCAPGKVELRLLEKEILDAPVVKPVARNVDILLEARILSRNNSEDFNPREGEEKKSSTGGQQFVSIHITNPSGETQRGSESDDLVSLTLSQRDLLGGSTTDLSSLDQPLPPAAVSPGEELSRYSDPFDTSLAEQVAAPSKVELKFLEQELPADLPDPLQDEDFDPRSGVKGVSFDIPSPVPDLLSSVKEEVGTRPLTPFYAEPVSAESDVDFDVDVEDPFDTSHVTHLPGKQELKLIEQELGQVPNFAPVVPSVHEKLGILPEPVTGIKHSTSDQDFNPRAEEASQLVCQPKSIRRFSDISGLNTAVSRPVPFKPSLPEETEDFLFAHDDISEKALTPAVEEDLSSYLDPFDTTIAENLAPGKAELKVLEVELVGSITRSYTDDDFNPREATASEGKLKTVLSTKPLTPSVTDPDDIDPFDTSIADNVGPGKAELRLLESELVG